MAQLRELLVLGKANFLNEVTTSQLLKAHGGISLNSSTAELTSLEYVLGIKPFASGGNVVWSSVSDFANVMRLNASGTWAINISGLAAKATADASGNTITSTYLKLSGGTMTGPIIMNANTGLQMKYESGKNTIWMCLDGADSYGIRYSKSTVDQMMFSASGNNTTAAGADLCINGNGAGTVTIRGDTILHEGNYTSYTVTKTGSGASGTWNITSAYAQKLETWYTNKNQTYGSQYPLYAWWETNNICKLTVDGYSTKVDQAVKLSTAKTINGTSFDGTDNITTVKWGTARNIYITDYYGSNTGAAVSVDGNTNATLKLPQNLKVGTINTNLSSGRAHSSDSSKYYHKIATFTQSIAEENLDTSLTFLVTGYYSSARRWNGILKASVRWSKGSATPGFTDLKWIVCDSDIIPDNYILTYSKNDSDITLNIYTYLSTSWLSLNFTKLSEHDWGNSNGRFDWTLLYAMAPTNCISTIPTTETQVASTVNPIYINTVSNTWANGTASAGPALSTTVNGVTGTAVRIPVATNTLCGATKVYKAADCVAFTDDTYALTCAAVQKSFNYFGWGLRTRGTQFSSASITDLNTTIDRGNYYANNSTQAGAISNGPTTGSGYRLIEQEGYNGSSSGYGRRFAFGSGETFYYQAETSTRGSWNPWRQIIHTGNFKTHLDSTYVNADGDTMTGALNMSSANINITSANLFIQSTNPYVAFKNSSGTVKGYVQYIETSDTYALGAGSANSLWVTAAGSISIPASQSITPRTDNTGSLGTSANEWANAYVRNITSGSTLYISSADGTSIIFSDGETENVRINPSGCLNVGSNQTSGDYKLWVQGTSVLQTTYPRVTNTYDLGAPTLIWNQVYALQYLARGTSDTTVTYAQMYTHTEGTTSTLGRGYLTAGNGTASGTAGNAYGLLRLYSESTGYANLRARPTITNDPYLYLPAATGYLVYNPEAATAVGSASVPVYVNAASKVVACTGSSVFSALSWSAGTTAGPTLNATVAGYARTAVIPSASSSASGIVTTGGQTFAGLKTFNSGLNSKDILYLQDTALVKGTAPSESTGTYISFVDSKGTAAKYRTGMIYSYVDSSNIAHMRVYAYRPLVDSTASSYLDLMHGNDNSTHATYSGGYFEVKRLIATATQDAASGAANAVALITGTPTGIHMEFDNNEIYAKDDGTTAGTLYLQSGAGTTQICTHATFTNTVAGGFNFAGRIDVGCLLLTNTEWTGYGTADPDGAVTAVKGRVYFKLI